VKKYKNYEEYLKSDKWKEIKEDFRKNYNSSGWDNVCEVTGEILIDKYEMAHHHFKYPTNWEEDSPENIVLISRDLHALIHKIAEEEEENPGLDHNPQEKDLENRHKYLSYLRKKYIEMIINDWTQKEDCLLEISRTKSNKIKDLSDRLIEKNIIIRALTEKIQSMDKKNG